MTPEIDRGMIELRNRTRRMQLMLRRERRRRRLRTIGWGLLGAGTLAVAWITIRLLLWTRLP